MTKGQQTGMRGVYLVASELTKPNFGLIVCTTSRNAQGADLLVADQECKRTFSVQVKTRQIKTNAPSAMYWLIGKKGQEIISETHVYVLVFIKGPSRKIPKEELEYYVVPSKVIAEKLRYDVNHGQKQGEWWYVTFDDVLPYKNIWDIFLGGGIVN